MRLPRRALTWLLALTAGAGCARSTNGGVAAEPALAPDSPAEPLRVTAPVLFPGEQMSWDVKVLGVSGGSASMVVGTPGDFSGHRAVIVRHQAVSAGVLASIKHVRDDVTSTIDLDGGWPLHSIADFEFGDRASLIEAEFGDDRVAIDYRRRDAKPRTIRLNLPEGERAYNTHSLVGALRAWESQPRQRAYLYSVGGRRLYRVELIDIAREDLDTGIGEFATKRIDGVGYRLDAALERDKNRQPEVFSLWISDDDDRLPLRFEAKSAIFGKVRIDLVGYDRPNRTASLSPGEAP